jgi:glycosyltransferase involved in cell wall biosynthesis
VGGEGWLMENFQAEINRLGLTKDVRVMGYLEDGELQWLYQNCFAFIYPSLFEGFGMPVLEAMSCGAPIITSKTTSIPEIVDSAGILINPYEVDQLCGAMENLIWKRVNRLELKEKALKQAKKFSWQQAADKTLALYHSVLHLAKQSRSPKRSNQPQPV